VLLTTPPSISRCYVPVVGSVARRKAVEASALRHELLAYSDSAGKSDPYPDATSALKVSFEPT
jgi:hypothetical protein